jgi:large subunit ribosomal protein L25
MSDSATTKLTIAAKIRVHSTKGSLGVMRRAGNVPGILYGLKSEPTMIEVNAVELRPILAGRNLVFDLVVNGKTESVMVKQVERDSIRRDLVHIDFLRVNETHPVIVTIPVITHGIPVGVKQQGGLFSVMKKSVRVKIPVKSIPTEIKIDVSDMPAGKIFYVRDLTVENGVFLTPGKTALFGVTSGRAADEAEAAGKANAAAAAAAKTAAPAAAKAAAAKPGAAAKPAAAPAAKKK